MSRGPSLIILAVVLLAAVAVLGLNPGNGETGERLVLTTFPSLEYDVRALLDGCPVVVKSIAPAGVDPHSYNLEPSKVDEIKRADLIVSTGHAPFEIRLRALVEDNRLVEVNSIPGVTLKELPNGAVNLHLPIYDPYNYLAFVDYLATRLASLYPDCAEAIQANAGELESILREKALPAAGSLEDTPGVLSTPVEQYAVEWLGVHAQVVLVVEHGASISPQALEKAEDTLSKGGVAVLLIASPEDQKLVTAADEWLSEKALEYDSRVLLVPAPYTPGSVLEKILFVASQAGG